VTGEGGVWTWIDFYISGEKKNEQNIATDVDSGWRKWW